MKAIRSIGLGKSIKFLVYGVLQKLSHLIIIPQVRGFMLRLFGAQIGRDNIIGNVTFENLYHYGLGRLKTGSRCFVGDESLLDVRGGIILEDDVTVSNRTSIITHINVGYADHPLQRRYPTREARVRIKSGAYIGTGATILPGVTIGRESVVGAGAVVRKDVPAGTMVAGVPARIMKRI